MLITRLQAASSFYSFFFFFSVCVREPHDQYTALLQYNSVQSQCTWSSTLVSLTLLQIDPQNAAHTFAPLARLSRSAQYVSTV